MGVGMKFPQQTCSPQMGVRGLETNGDLRLTGSTGGASEPLRTPHRDHRQRHLPPALSAAVPVSGPGPLPQGSWSPGLRSSHGQVAGSPTGPSWSQVPSERGCGVCWTVWRDSASRVPFIMFWLGFPLHPGPATTPPPTTDIHVGPIAPTPWS